MNFQDNTNTQKRLAVLVCQLKKAESGKKTYEVATEKLVKYVEVRKWVICLLSTAVIDIKYGIIHVLFMCTCGYVMIPGATNDKYHIILHIMYVCMYV